MMGFALSQRTSSVTVNTAIWEIRAGYRDAYITEIGITQTAATGAAYGVGRPQVSGISPTAPQTFVSDDDVNSTSTTQGAVAWGTGPTQPASFSRRMTTTNAIGAGVIWTFPRALECPGGGGSVVIWATATPVACDVWAHVLE